MNEFIKNILRENIQQADKVYFNDGKLAPEVREKILTITHGDVYTKLLTDLYFYYNRGESNTQYDANVYKLMSEFYNNIKTYNKGILPVQGNIMDYSIDKNDPWHITNLYSMLDWRQIGIKALDKLPSVVIRNIKEIRIPTDSRYNMEAISRNLRTLSDLINEMDLREEKKNDLIGKIASSKETLESMVEIAQHFYDSLLQIEDTDIDEVLYEIGEQNAVLKQNKNNVLVVKIKDEAAAQALSCGTTWCFARPNSTEFWDDYAQMGYLYYIYDFNKEMTDALFLMTMIPSTYEVYAGTNVSLETLGIDDGMNYLESIGVNTQIFAKDYEKATKPKKEKIKGDPNQLQFAFETKNYIQKLLRENLQQADKFYFKNGILSPRVREVMLRITNGDPYTKILTDIYYFMLMEGHRTGNWALSHIDPTHVATEKPENDVMGIEDWKKLKDIYQELKTYNKNVYPISGFNINGVENVGYFINALKQRKTIVELINKLPSVAIRNLKEDIRQIRDYPELQGYRAKLEHFINLYSLLSNRNDDGKKRIENKMFRGKTTLYDLIDFAEEKENLIGGTDLTRKKIGEILKQDQEDNYSELRVRYSKGDIMIIEVTGTEGIKKIGCNSLWCFTYNRHNGEPNWVDWQNYSTDGYVYVIIDFSQPSDSETFMYVLIKPLSDEYTDEDSGDDVLATMGNNYEEDPLGVISSLMDLDTAKKIMNFGNKPPKVKQKKQKYVDPNQLSLDLQEAKIFIKNILRESLNIFSDNQK